MKKQTKVIASSVAAIALCASLVAGSTFALFTSESKVNIAITSAKVEVSANVSGAELYRPQTIDADTYAASFAVDEAGNELATQAIETNGKSVSLENLAPGDKVKISVDITSQSTIQYQYRVGVELEDGDADFYDNLLVGIDGVYYSELVSAWELSDKVSADGKAVSVMTTEIELILPAYLNNDYTEKSCNLAFKVEAVQGNVDKSNDGVAKIVYPVYSQDELDEVGAKISDGDTVVLMQKWNNVAFNTAAAVDFDIKGCNSNNVTVNAPEATIDYYVADTETLDIQAIAPDSFHLYGKVNGLGLKQGRVVVEDAAEVVKATVAPEAEQTAILKIKEDAAAKQIEATAEGTVIIENEGIVETLEADNENVLLDNVGIIETVVGDVEYTATFVSTWEELKAALADGGKIALTADITAPEIIDITKSTYLIGNGHTIVSTATRILWISVSDVEVSLSHLNLLKGNNGVERGVQVNLNITGVKLHMNACKVEATYYAVNICTGAEVDLTINNSEITGWGAINAWSNGYSIRISNSILRGVNDKSYSAAGWNGFGTVVIEGDTTYKTEVAAELVDIELVNCKIIAESKTGNLQRCILFNSQSKGNTVNVIDCEFVLENEDCREVTDNGTDNVLNIISTKD